MTIFNIDTRLLDFLRSRQGMELSESDIIKPLCISHGTFSAVRRRLIDEGRLSCSRVGRKLLFRVLDPPSSSAAGPGKASKMPGAADPGKASKTPRAAAGGDVSAVLAADEPAPRVIGWFASIDDWTEILIQRLGDVSVDQIDDEEYSVIIMATFEEQIYTSKESAGGVEIS